MIIGHGTFSGRNNYRLEGTFTLTKDASGDVYFETSDDFFFGNNQGGGTPAPGFAFYSGDPTNAPENNVEKAARQTDFFRIAEDTVSVTGKQKKRVPSHIDINAFDTVFLWCFSFPVLLGVGAIQDGGNDGGN